MIMQDKLASAIGFGRQALHLRAERQQLLANNVANADTPQFKARDFNFSQALTAATDQAASGGTLKMVTTSTGHLEGTTTASAAPKLLYRVPAQPSLDGNTVDMDAERAAFADNTVRYEASLSLLNFRIRNLRMAMQAAS
jgi:flagellar basal-body rod protein FlgB